MAMIASVKHKGNIRQPGTLSSWVIPLVFSLALTILFFDFMPVLIGGNFDKPGYTEYAEKVNIIRIKRQEQPARRKELPKKIRPEKKIKKLLQKKMIFKNKAVKRAVDLPFEINPKLPAITGTLKIPPMQMVHLDSPGLESSYGIGEIDHPLTPLAQIPPIYPIRARHRGIEGHVKVRFIVTEEGRVDDIKILESRPENVFDNAVFNCVSAWRFTPGTVEGVPVKTWVETTVRFDLR